jgi:hypothetical protein
MTHEAQPLASLVAEDQQPQAGAAARMARRAEARTFLFDALHLLVLSSFAVARPLFDVLAAGASFFAVRGSSAAEIVEFALIVTLVPPFGIAAAELFARLVAGRIGRVFVHAIFVASLLALIGLQALKDAGLSAERTLFVAAGLLGIAGGLVYLRWRPARSMLSVLAPAPLVFLALFLFNSPVSRLVLTDDAKAASARVTSDTPVVMVVFDEFSGGSLLDGRGRIDPRRYPNFAALARTSTWFRNAASVNLGTVRALPAMLTGRYTSSRSLPIYRDHPNNLFTFLGDRYDLNVHEAQTHLCPPRLCPNATQTGIDPGLGSLFSDVSIVYSHIVLPKALADRLPSVSTAWGNFRGDDADFHFVAGHRTAAFLSFVRSVARRPRPTLNFVHVELPHFPWDSLPSGKRYPAPADYIPGLDRERWGSDRWLALQAQQRYLLQVGYVDRLLGQLLAHLRATGLFDRAILVVTADHGVSFHAGEGRRTTGIHREDLALVPLFVKAPGQRTGDVADQVVETVDIVPTIAELLRAAVPWRVDGRSAVEGSGRRTIRNEDRTFDAATLVRRRDAAAARSARTFGVGWPGVFRAGPRSELVGRPVTSLRRLPASDLRGTLNDEYQFRAIDLTGRFVPSFVLGSLTGSGARPGIDVAVAVNGRVEGTGRSYERAGVVLFAAIVPDRVFKRGSNAIDVFTVSGRSGAPALRPVTRFGTRDAVTFRLENQSGSPAIVSSTGERIRVVPGAVVGYLDSAEVEDERINFVGWAADVQRRRIRDRVLVFVNGRFLYAFRTIVPRGRPDLPRGLAGAGFDFSLPVNLVERGEDPHVQIFGVIGDRASELVYPLDYRWGPEAG